MLVGFYLILLKSNRTKSMQDFQEVFKSFSSVKVGVIGDLMLDTYMWGHVDRISPEAPVPIVSLEKNEFRIGGAGNVALNLQSLGAKAFVLSVTGDDGDADKLNALLAAQSINSSYCFRSRSRITTNKTRVISRNQQMMRLDSEITNDLSRNDETNMIELFESFAKTTTNTIFIFLNSLKIINY